MTPAQHAEAFASRWRGQYIDEDFHYGSQCWDVVAKYAREEYGCPSFPTVSGGAEGLWRFFADPIPQYFDKVTGNILKGDVVVWDQSFFPPYGHTALAMEDSDGTTILVLEQDGSNDPNHDDVADGVSYLKRRSLYKINGVLRPKGSNTVSPTRKPISAQLVSEHYSNYTGVDVKPNDPACQNRFEDGSSDEFWYGLVPMINNIRLQQVKRIAELEKQVAATSEKCTKEERQLLDSLKKLYT